MADSSRQPVWQYTPFRPLTNLWSKSVNDLEQIAHSDHIPVRKSPGSLVRKAELIARIFMHLMRIPHETQAIICPDMVALCHGTHANMLAYATQLGLPAFVDDAGRPYSQQHKADTMRRILLHYHTMATKGDVVRLPARPHALRQVGTKKATALQTQPSKQLVSPPVRHAVDVKAILAHCPKPPIMDPGNSLASRARAVPAIGSIEHLLDLKPPATALQKHRRADISHLSPSQISRLAFTTDCIVDVALQADPERYRHYFLAASSKSVRLMTAAIDRELDAWAAEIGLVETGKLTRPHQSRDSSGVGAERYAALRYLFQGMKAMLKV